MWPERIFSYILSSQNSVMTHKSPTCSSKTDRSHSDRGRRQECHVTTEVPGMSWLGTLGPCDCTWQLLVPRQDPNPDQEWQHLMTTLLVNRGWGSWYWHFLQAQIRALFPISTPPPPCQSPEGCSDENQVAAPAHAQEHCMEAPPLHWGNILGTKLSYKITVLQDRSSFSNNYWRKLNEYLDYKIF